MPPKKKTFLTRYSDTSSEWIPGSEMVFEMPTPDLTSRSRRSTQRFTRSLQIVEKEVITLRPDTPSQPFVSPPGVKTRLRRQSMFVFESTPSALNSVVNSAVTSSASKKKGPRPVNQKKRLPIKSLDTPKSSEPVSETNPPDTETPSKKDKGSSNNEKDGNKNLLDTDEINAIIDNFQDKRKRKSNIFSADPQKKSKTKPSIEQTKDDFNDSKVSENTKGGEKESEELSDSKVLNRRKSTREKKIIIEEEISTKSVSVEKSNEKKVPKEREFLMPKKSLKPRKSVEKKQESGQKHQEKEEISDGKKSRKRPKVTTSKEEDTKIDTDGTSKKLFKTESDAKNKKNRVSQEMSQAVKDEILKPGKSLAKNRRSTNRENKAKDSVNSLSPQKRQQHTSNIKAKSQSVEENLIRSKVNSKKKQKSKQKTDNKEEKTTKESSPSFQAEDVHNETITRRVTRQMASLEGSLETEKVELVDKISLGIEEPDSPQIKIFKLDNQAVTDPHRLSSESEKNEKNLLEKKSRRKSSPNKSVPSQASKKQRSPRKQNISKKTRTPRKQRASSKEANQIKCLSAENDEKNPKVSNSDVEDVIPKNTKKDIPKTAAETPDVLEENSESSSKLDNNLKSTLQSSEQPIKSNLLSNEPETIKSDRQEVAVTTEGRRKFISKKTGLLSTPLLSSTPDSTKKPKTKVKTSFATKIHKAVSDLPDFSLRKSFEYTRTTIASANNQSIEEFLVLQKVSHNKANNESEKDQIKSNKINEIRADLSVNKEELLNPRSEEQLEGGNEKIQTGSEETILTDKSVISPDVGISFPYKSLDNESPQSDKEMSTIEKNEEHVFDSKSIHYESQQSEMEEESNVSQDDVTNQDTNNIPETKSIHYESQSDMEEESNVSQDDVTNQDTNNIPVTKSIHYESQQSEMEEESVSQDEVDDVTNQDTNNIPVTKSIHYESQQSEMDEESNMSQNDIMEVSDATSEVQKVRGVTNQDNNIPVSVTKSMHYESQESEIEEEMIVSQDDIDIVTNQDNNNVLVTKSIHYESQHSEIEEESNMSQDDAVIVTNKDNNNIPVTKSMHYESQESEIEEMIVSQDDAVIVTNKDNNNITVMKSIHYESQHSEIEEELHVSQDDVEVVTNQDDNNIPISVAKSIDCNSQDVTNQDTNMVFDPTELHSVASQSDGGSTSNIVGDGASDSKIRESENVKPGEMEEKIVEEEDDDIDLLYNASYSSYGLRCIIL